MAMAKTTTDSASHARFTHVRMSARKVEGVVNMVRGKRVEEAIALLQFCPRRGASVVLKLLKSAVANADQRGGVDVDRLFVQTIHVDGGPQMKRYRPRSRGMAHPILKRSSHIEVVLGEK